MRICPNCARPTPDTDPNCVRCGSTPSTPVTLRGGIKPLRTLGIAVVVAVAVAVVADLAATLNLLRTADLVADPATALDGHESVAFLDNLQTVLAIPAAVLMIAWTYRARKNLDAFPHRGSLLSARWAVWGWLIPFVSFFMPYRVVNQIVREEKLPRWAGPFVGLWWAAFVATTIFGIWIGNWSGADFASDEAFYREIFGPWMVRSLVYAGAGALLAAIVLLTGRAQEARGEQVARAASPVEALGA